MRQYFDYWDEMKAPSSILFGLQLPLAYDTIPAAALLAVTEINNSTEILNGVELKYSLVVRYCY